MSELRYGKPSNFASRKATREAGEFVPFVPPESVPNSTFASRKAAREKAQEKASKSERGGRR